MRILRYQTLYSEHDVRPEASPHGSGLQHRRMPSRPHNGPLFTPRNVSSSNPRFPLTTPRHGAFTNCTNSRHNASLQKADQLYPRLASPKPAPRQPALHRVLAHPRRPGRVHADSRVRGRRGLPAAAREPGQVARTPLQSFSGLESHLYNWRREPELGVHLAELYGCQLHQGCVDGCAVLSFGGSDF